MDEGAKLRRMVMLRHQVQEIERAKLKPGESDQLEERRKILQNAEKVEDGLEIAVGNLYGDDNGFGAEAMLSQASEALRRISRFDAQFEKLAAQATDIMYQIQDLAVQVRDVRDGLAYSEEELEQVENRLAMLQKLFRKYGVDEVQILAYLDSAKQELDQMEFADDRIQQCCLSDQILTELFQ